MATITNLHKSFGENTVLDGIDLQIEKGEIVVILGPSGSGKSTLLRCLNFLETPELGVIDIAGQSVDAATSHTKDILALRRHTAFVFQNYALFKNKTALGNITEALTVVKGMAAPVAEGIAMDILKSVGLADRRDAWPSELSGGQQQRIGIGRAMALDADLMLFDEPTSALDPEKVYEVLDLMKQLARQKRTMIIVTHEIPFAREVADRIIFMDGGKIIEQGMPEQVLDAPQDSRTQTFLRQVLS
uniref:amino acid ABC transporter ATP-binding protein n=1 Tax=Sansalvadorimonas verongulae TaxID=2172824 RepID=UPI0018AD239F